MAAHDQRFKVLLQEFLAEFLLLFFPDLLDQLDLRRVEWLHQELYPDPPQGRLLTLDLIVSIPIRQAQADGPVQTILLHLEIEADDTVEPFRQRLYEYFHFLTRKYGPKVLPIAVYLRVGVEGKGKDAHVIQVLGRTVLRFEYDYVGLPGLPGQPFLVGDNLLGVAWSALMRWPRQQRALAAVQALERIVGSQEEPARKRMLCECIQAYAPLEEDQRLELNSLLQRPERKGEFRMFKTWAEEAEERGIKVGEERGIKVGEERGIKVGERRLLLKQLEVRFAPLSESVRERVAQLSEERVEELGLALLNAHSLRELELED
jgi:hypothetical protein